MNANLLDSGFDGEVIIVGAGPAGATAAYYLAKAGRNVVVLDSNSFPRGKVCGDFVGSKAIEVLREMGVTDEPEFKNVNSINEVGVYLDGEKMISSGWPSFAGLEKSGKAIPRKLLDNWVLAAARKAGANMLENVQVTGFTVEKDGVKVSATAFGSSRIFRAKLLVGADGANSIIGRILRGYSTPVEDRIVAVRGYFKNFEGSNDEADLHFLSDAFQGYCWLLPTGKNEVNVGAGLLETASNQPQAFLSRFMNEDKGLKSRLKNAKLKGNLEICSLNTYDRRLPIVGDRVMLIGEAANLVNPINGEGVQYALVSGKWASETAIAAMDKGDFSVNTLSKYAKRVDEEVGLGLQVSALIDQFARNRSLNPVWLKAFEAIVERSKKDPEYLNLVGGIMAGLVPANQGLDPKFLITTLQEASVSAGIKMVVDAVNNPAALPKTGVDAARTCVDVAFNTAQNPVDFVRWSLETAGKMAELAASVPTQALQQTHKSPGKKEKRASDYTITV